MKLPFDFSLKFVFRMLLPGFIISLAGIPVLQTCIESLNVNFQTDYAFLLSVVVIGWLFPVLDMHLYMIYEGRRYWPARMHKFFLKREKRRLEKLRQRSKTFIETDQRDKQREVSVELRRFPMDSKGQYIATSPTRLGNLLASYEEYPLRIYGMDSIFYWYRIWLTLDSKLQDHIDDQQALADSTIYTAFALLCSGLLCSVYASLTFFGIRWIDYLPTEKTLLGISFLCFLGSYFLYRASLHLHAQFGEIFKSLFDVHRDKISVDKIISDISQITEDMELAKLPDKDRFEIAWRYLHNYRIKTPDGTKVSPSEFPLKKKEFGQDKVRDILC